MGKNLVLNFVEITNLASSHKTRKFEFNASVIKNKEFLPLNNLQTLKSPL